MAMAGWIEEGREAEKWRELFFGYVPFFRLGFYWLGRQVCTGEEVLRGYCMKKKSEGR
jgi:hypothetical protein